MKDEKNVTLEDCVEAASDSLSTSQHLFAELTSLRTDAELGRRFRDLANNPKHHLGTLTLFAAECCKLIAEYDKEDRHEY